MPISNMRSQILQILVCMLSWSTGRFWGWTLVCSFLARSVQGQPAQGLQADS